MPHSSVDSNRDHDDVVGADHVSDPAESAPEPVPLAASTPVDPVIWSGDTHATLVPVIRPSAGESEDSSEESGFVRHLAESLRHSWQTSAGEDAAADWAEFEADPHPLEEEAEETATEALRFEFDSRTAPITQIQPLSADPEAPASHAATPAEPSQKTPRGWLGTPCRSSRDPSVQSSGARLILRRVIQQPAPATGQMPMIDYLSGSLYENPQEVEEPCEAEELEALSFVLDLGEALFRYGAGALEVETSIIATSAAFGMKNTDADITNQSIILNWAPDGKVPYSRVRVVRSWSANFRALSEVHGLVTDIAAGRYTRAEAQRELAEITSEPKPYPRWAVTLAGAVFAGLFASYTGAPPLDAALGFAAALLVLAVTRRLTLKRVPEIFALAAGGMLATLVALCALTLGADITPSMVVAGGLMILLPSVRIVSALQDAINAFPITAAGRLVSSLVAFAGMTAGIMVAVVLADRVGAPQVEVAEGITRIYHPVVLVCLVFLTAVTAAVVQQAPYRLLLPTGAIAACGFMGFYTGELLGFGDWFTPLLGAIVIGALARVTALWLGAPQLVVAVPAMMFMLPGLVMFRGMYQIAISDAAGLRSTGLYLLFDALIIITAIAAGIVLGDVTMRPLTKRLRSNERARGRRR
ncbi:threonine/serine ThrE exporter family protein [Garicola koreensis]|uniref:Uncharacterized membrane protein YjjP (DUF1212 family) n=1 Tax=Garicola koreensis TaxID=1262554 RepID=A0A7W5TSI8_9MICC|nr:threonine/serine exporter family protein [Garicola koreensis]MBB3666978.1 uncharacterized membrane protein YjjP (DUF1212 family) [Garicola koreensis]